MELSDEVFSVMLNFQTESERLEESMEYRPANFSTMCVGLWIYSSGILVVPIRSLCLHSRCIQSMNESTNPVNSHIIFTRSTEKMFAENIWN